MKKISRSKIDLFVTCPCCFYLSEVGSVSRPSIPSFTINNTVDELLKKEFDAYRIAGAPHPLMVRFGIQAIPFNHPDVEKWRKNKIGVQCSHAKTGLLVFGALDDVWVDRNGILYVVDYKATSLKEAPTLEGRNAYKRQMEVYQWLLRQNGFQVSDRGYFVYCNGIKNKDSFDARIDFAIDILPYEGDSRWVEPALLEIRKCLDGGEIPRSGEACEYCAYQQEAKEFLDWQRDHFSALLARKTQILNRIQVDYSNSPVVFDVCHRLLTVIQQESLETKGEFDSTRLLEGIDFALQRHHGQFRKNSARNPYVAHPLEVAYFLWKESKMRDVKILLVSLLHDTLEDTNTSFEELIEKFGFEIATVVRELTNDPALSGEENKCRQVEKAASMTHEAKIVKMADRIHNLCEIATDPPVEWEKNKIEQYVEWSRKLLKEMKGTDKILESALRKRIKELSKNSEGE